MYRFIHFNDEKIDSMLLMELADLTRTLTKDYEYETEFRVHSYLDKSEKRVYVSHFWNHRPVDIMRAGMKSDVFLRALGNIQFTNFPSAIKFYEQVEGYKHPRFIKQLFKLAEDLRIEEECKKIRPGMIKEFTVRRQIYMNYFQSQLTVNVAKSFQLDAIYNLAYILLNTDSPNISYPQLNAQVNEMLPLYRSNLEKLFDATTTAEVADISLQIAELVESYINKDMINDYFHLPQLDAEDVSGQTYSELLRKDPLKNDDQAEESASGDEEVFNEEMKTWHRETSDPGKSFMQFDLEQGTQTDILANEAREGEAGDQALAIVQGSARKSSNKDFSDLQSMESMEIESGKVGTPYGKENKYARPIFLPKVIPSQDEINKYAGYKKNVSLYQKKLKNVIDITLEHKKIQPRTDLLYGRLNKKILRFFTEEQPRLFYKKNEPSNEINAVFSLLIDCSASMQDKMEETKLGITLFHEALKSVKVPHEITGFWEDAGEASEKDQPNYFKKVIDFSTSLHAKSGPEILQLEAEEDNRDGYAIRVCSERLYQRIEEQKFLLIFSDGEPAAYGYSQNGIIDTHEAVQEARKRGIEVFNIFLSMNGVEEEQRKVFQNIYGPYSLVVPSIDKLPDMLFPLLRKLLFQSIR
ncbi:vWA domain-containing protein [Lederbergia lenta]|uniref:vWA domain-containing protein n=1 Tax=Lederbergia lenta TaxID=1467 RepID=UPI00203C0BF1|nr:hypothetical protein [Lederbergia lenta]MCM3109430.1 hypothetical protein [Lederbergia lenta]